LLAAILMALALALEAEAQTATKSVLLTWTDNSDNEEGFFIYRDSQKIGEVKANVTTYTDQVTGAWNQKFTYQVSAFNHKFVDGTGDLQESGKSNEAYVTIPVPEQPAPKDPSNLIEQFQEAKKQYDRALAALMNFSQQQQ
jgi:hypothetical protein